MGIHLPVKFSKDRSSVSENLVGQVQGEKKKRNNNNNNNNKKRYKNHKSPNFVRGLNYKKRCKNNKSPKFGDLIINRFHYIGMQTQKSPNDPHIRIQGTNLFLTSKYS
jgi:hypothetical protein